MKYKLQRWRREPTLLKGRGLKLKDKVKKGRMIIPETVRSLVKSQDDKDCSQSPSKKKKDGEVGDGGMNKPIKKLACKALSELLRKYPADDITKKMICQQGNISRQAFYNHYNSVSDTVSDMLQRRFMALHSSQCVPEEDWTEDLQKLLRSLQSEREAVLNLYNSTYQKDMVQVLEFTVDRRVRQEIKDRLQENQSISETDQMFLISMYHTLVMGLLTQYIESDLNPEVLKIVNRWAQMLKGTLPIRARSFIELKTAAEKKNELRMLLRTGCK